MCVYLRIFLLLSPPSLSLSPFLSPLSLPLSLPPSLSLSPFSPLSLPPLFQMMDYHLMFTQYTHSLDFYR